MIEIKQVLLDRFGFADFRPGQAEVIGFLLAGALSRCGIPNWQRQVPLLPVAGTVA